MAKYYYIMKTTMKNDKDDPARKFTDEYADKGNSRVFFGDGVAVVELELVDAPVISLTDVSSKEVITKSVKELDTTFDSRLIDYGFDSNIFRESAILTAKEVTK